LDQLFEAVLAASDEVTVVEVLQYQPRRKRSDDGRQPDPIGDPL
jgi:hypothetical protein